MELLAQPATVTFDTETPSIEAALANVFVLADLRPSTRRTYQYAAKHFTKWAQGRQLDALILVAYKNYLRDNVKLSAKTRNLYLAAARTIFRQLFTVGILPFDASKMVRSFTVGKNHTRQPISDAQIKRAFSYATASSNPRMVLILNLLFRQGLRQKEVVDICVEHFNER